MKLLTKKRRRNYIINILNLRKPINPLSVMKPDNKKSKRICKLNLIRDKL